MGMIAALPWNFVIIAALITLQQTATPTDGLVEKALFILYLCSLIFGFINSANITTRNFTILIIHSVLSVAVASGFISYLYWGTNAGLEFIYGTGLAIVLINAIISPINSFKSALRDYQIDDNHD
jgi:hypothetical protein